MSIQLIPRIAEAAAITAGQLPIRFTDRVTDASALSRAGRNAQPIVRTAKKRRNVAVSAVAATASHSFRVDTKICQGDSPTSRTANWHAGVIALSRRSALSRSGMPPRDLAV